MLDRVAAGADVLLALRCRRWLDNGHAKRKPLRGESKLRRSHFDLVALRQGAGLGQHCSVDGGGINATRMQNEFAILCTQLGVVSRDGGLADEDMARCIATDRQQRVPDGVGAPLELVYQVGAVVARGL